MISWVFYSAFHRKFSVMTNTPLLWLSEDGNYILTAFRILPVNWKSNNDVVQCWHFFFFFLGITLFLSSLNDGSQITEEIWKRLNFFLSSQQHLSFFEHNQSRIYIFQGLVVWHSHQRYCCFFKKHLIVFVPRQLNRDKNQYLEGTYDSTFSSKHSLRSKVCLLIYCYWLAICSDSIYVEINILDVHWHLKAAFPLNM